MFRCKRDLGEAMFVLNCVMLYITTPIHENIFVHSMKTILPKDIFSFIIVMRVVNKYSIKADRM